MSRENESVVLDWAGARGEKWRSGLTGMEATLAPIDDPLIRALALDAPYRIVDVGCGGGGTALEILRRAPAGTVVHGFDISPTLIEAARARTRRGERAIAFDVADMADAPPPEVLYDRLVSRFGVMFFDDPPAAFANLARWLAPGGRFALAVWGPATANPMAIIREVVADLVEMPPTDPEGPGPFRYADVGELLGLLARAGFGALEAHDWCGPLPLGGGVPAAEAATFALASAGNFAELLAVAGDEARRAAHESLTARLRAHERGGSVWVDARAHIVTGARA